MSPHQLSSLVSGRMEAKALDGDPFLITLIPKISEPKVTRLEVIQDQIHFLSLKLIRAWGVGGLGGVVFLSDSDLPIGPLSSA